MYWLKLIFLPWLIIKDVKKKWLREMSAANELVERAARTQKKVKYLKIDYQDENSIPYLEEIESITANECFVFLVNSVEDALQEEMMKIGSSTIEEHTQKFDGDTQVKIVAVKSPENETMRIKYMLSGIDFLKLAMTSRVRALAQLRSGGENAQISL